MVAAGLLVVGMTLPMVAPTSANAAGGLPVPGPATSLSDAFGQSTPSYLAALLCPVATTAKQVTSTIPGVAVLTDQMANILCALGILGYAYRTTYYPTSGPPQVRYFRALAGVPQPLDVNGDLIPDFVGTLAPAAGIPGIQLAIDRTGMPVTARVKIEAVLLDPADQTTWVGVGEDGTVNGTAKYWRALVGLFAVSGTSIDLGVDFFSQYSPPSEADLGEAFFGSNPDAPTSIDRGSMNFAPVPVNFSTRLRVGPSSQTANISSTIPTTVTANVQVIKPGNEKDIDAVIDQLPTSIEISHQTSNGHELVTYSANNVIAHVTGAYHDRAGSNILTAAQVDITNLPSAFTLDQSDGVTVFNVPNGAIGNVEVRFATGQDVPASPAGTAPYVAFHRFSSSHLTAGLRLGNIKSVSFDQRGPYVGDIVFSTAPGLIPLSFVDDVSGITASGHLSNLPAHLTVTIDLSGGHVVFDGHGTGIHEIAVSATKTGGTFFTRASRIDLTIVDLPALDTIDFTPNGQSVTFTPSAPIGSVSLLASDGTGAPVVTGDYASYEDTPTLYRIYLQMLSIAGVSFSAAPTVTATLKTGVRQPMTLFAHIADQALTHNLTVNGTITNLPTNITVTADLNGGSVTYDAHSQTIDEIHVTARDTLANFFGRVNRVDLDILNLPATNTVTFLPNGQGATFTPSAPIGSVSLLASDGASAPVVSGDYVSYEDTPSLYRIYVQMLGISGLSFNANPISGQIKTSSPQLMTLYGHLQNMTDDITINGSINQLPSQIDFSLAHNGDGSSTVDYNTHGQVINNITLDATGVPLPFGADTVHVSIDHIPSHITATIPTSGGSAIFDPHGDHINRVLVQAYPHATGAHNSVAGHQTAYANLSTGQFTADIQNIGFTKFTTGTTGINVQYDISSAPLDFEFDTTDGKFFKGQISNPEPATITVNTSNRTQINYTVNNASSNFTGTGEINEIDVQTNVSGGYLDASLQHIAPKLLICFDSDGSTACTPGFVPPPGHYFSDTDGNQWLMPNSTFDFQLVPTALNNTAWPTRFRLDGTMCFSEPDPTTCLNSGNKKQRIVLSDLEFGKVAAGVGTASDDCTLCTAGRLYGYFDTDNTPITGDVQYFKDGDDDPFVHYYQDSGSGDSIQAQNMFLFAQYCTCVNEDLLDTVSGGSFSCTGSPHLDIDTFIDVDILSGSLISIC